MDGKQDILINRPAIIVVQNTSLYNAFLLYSLEIPLMKVFEIAIMLQTELVCCFLNDPTDNRVLGWWTKHSLY